MDRPGKFVTQHPVDEALTFDPAAIGEGSGYDFHPEMRFAFRPRTDMTGMKMRFVRHDQGVRRECLRQFFLDRLRYSHTVYLPKSGSSTGNTPIRGKRHVLAWGNSGDHTAGMSKEGSNNGSVLDTPLTDNAPGGAGQAPGADAAAAACDHPDCAEPGTFRAPKSRTELSNFYWFCLDHVREYNAAWNYYAGMDDAAVEAEIRKDIVWQRPTWPLGSRPGANGAQFHDPLSLLGDGPTDPRAEREAQVQMQNLTAPEREALSVLGLVAPITKADIKQRYKILAKSLHPDANGGDKRAEDRLKSVNHAYTTLRDSERLT